MMTYAKGSDEFNLLSFMYGLYIKDSSEEDGYPSVKSGYSQAVIDTLVTDSYLTSAFNAEKGWNLLWITQKGINEWEEYLATQVVATTVDPDDVRIQELQDKAKADVNSITDEEGHEIVRLMLKKGLVL